MRFDSVGIAVADGRPVLRAMVRIDAPIVFEPRVRMRVEAADHSIVDADSSASRHLGWLPRGTYRFDALLPRLPYGPARFTARLGHRVAMADTQADEASGTFHATTPDGVAQMAWSVESLPPAPPLAALSWNKGHADWFFRHFDHAALTVQSYLLGDSPRLRGRILDVGCGDGITDLALALRTGCEELVGVDPFRGYERLPQVLAENHLPPDAMPPSLRFMPEDANALPFEDDRFDVVVSWGSVEHIAGGYAKALSEMRRVLRPDGLLFIHPGLYYSNVGHHLGEFSSESHFHLKYDEAQLKRIVFESPMSRMDRSGHVASREEYWQWFKELNPITVEGFERELRALKLQPWRVALRTEPLIEYTPETYRYPMQDLATGEVYIACLNHKHRA